MKKKRRKQDEKAFDAQTIYKQLMNKKNKIKIMNKNYKIRGWKNIEFEITEIYKQK